MSAIPGINGLKARVAFRTQLQNGKLPIPVELGEFSDTGLIDSMMHEHSINSLNEHQTQAGYTHL